MISDMPQLMWSGAMVTWFERMTKSVRAEGGYLEKLDQARNPYMCRDLHIQKLMG